MKKTDQQEKDSDSEDVDQTQQEEKKPGAVAVSGKGDEKKKEEKGTTKPGAVAVSGSDDKKDDTKPGAVSVPPTSAVATTSSAASVASASTDSESLSTADAEMRRAKRNALRSSTVGGRGQSSSRSINSNNSREATVESTTTGGGRTSDESAEDSELREAKRRALQGSSSHRRSGSNDSGPSGGDSRGSGRQAYAAAAAAAVASQEEPLDAESAVAPPGSGELHRASSQPGAFPSGGVALETLGEQDTADDDGEWEQLPESALSATAGTSPRLGDLEEPGGSDLPGETLIQATLVEDSPVDGDGLDSVDSTAVYAMAQPVKKKLFTRKRVIIIMIVVMVILVGLAIGLTLAFTLGRRTTEPGANTTTVIRDTLSPTPFQTSTPTMQPTTPLEDASFDPYNISLYNNLTTYAIVFGSESTCRTHNMQRIVLSCQNRNATPIVVDTGIPILGSNSTNITNSTNSTNVETIKEFLPSTIIGKLNVSEGAFCGRRSDTIIECSSRGLGEATVLFACASKDSAAVAATELPVSVAVDCGEQLRVVQDAGPTGRKQRRLNQRNLQTTTFYFGGATSVYSSFFEVCIQTAFTNTTNTTNGTIAGNSTVPPVSTPAPLPLLNSLDGCDEGDEIVLTRNGTTNSSSPENVTAHKQHTYCYETNTCVAEQVCDSTQCRGKTDCEILVQDLLVADRVPNDASCSSLTLPAVTNESWSFVQKEIQNREGILSTVFDGALAGATTAAPTGIPTPTPTATPTFQPTVTAAPTQSLKIPANNGSLIDIPFPTASPTASPTISLSPGEQFLKNYDLQANHVVIVGSSSSCAIGGVHRVEISCGTAMSVFDSRGGNCTRNSDSKWTCSVVDAEEAVFLVGCGGNTLDEMRVSASTLRLNSIECGVLLSDGVEVDIYGGETLAYASYGHFCQSAGSWGLSSEASCGTGLQENINTQTFCYLSESCQTQQTCRPAPPPSPIEEDDDNLALDDDNLPPLPPPEFTDDNLALDDDYTPPIDDWTPPIDDYTPPTDDWTGGFDDFFVRSLNEDEDYEDEDYEDVIALDADLDNLQRREQELICVGSDVCSLSVGAVATQQQQTTEACTSSVGMNIDVDKMWDLVDSFMDNRDAFLAQVR